MITESSKYQPLYLKYRPQTLGQLVGQKSVVKTLTNALTNNRIAHAYLFTGPRGTGKTSSARILAKSINCDLGLTVTPCLECPSCQSIADSSSTSVFEIDAASNNSVDDARALIERAPLATQDGKHKLYIIDECHMLTKEAFNALLKTIEEPPPNVVFILATTEEHKVPPTIVSRCQRLMFRLVNQSDLVEHLDSVARRESIEITREALELMTRRSGGGLRDALGLLDQAALLSRPEEPVSASDLLILLGALNEDVLIEISEAVRVGGGSDALAKINELLMQGREPSLIAVELAKHFLNLTKASYLKENSAAVESQQLISGSASYVEKLIAQSCHYERSELSQIVERLDSMEQNIKRSTQPSMTLEMGILSICHRHDILSIAGLNQRIDDLERILEGDSGGNQLLKSRESDRPQATRPQASEHPYSKSSSDSPPPKIVEPKPQPQTEIHQPVSEPQVEAMPIVDHQTAITEPEQVEKPEPAQEPEQQAAKDRENPTGLEEVWSDIMDALHKRSIPAYSLVSMHAFPVSLENSQLTLGVNKEFFQKSIEGKAAHLIEAYKTLTGQDIVVKVKVLSEAPPSKKNSNGRNVVEKASEPESSPIKSDPEEAVSITDFGEARRSHTDTLTKAYTETITHAGSLSATNLTRTTASPPPVEDNQSQSLTAPDPQEGSTNIKEAYRIFEGPGSRQIG